ncbi:MAG: xylose isomerase, partial [Bacteroidota bacterium]
IADKVLSKTSYKQLKSDRYSSFDSGAGKAFESGEMTLEQLRQHAISAGEPSPTSGKQELLENLINQCI